MGEAIGATLGYAVAIAVSPLPIAAVILMLFSDRARTNSVGFMIAWIVGILVVTVVVLSVPGLEADDNEPADAAGWIKLGLGGLLAVGSIPQWRSRPGPDDEPETPAWLDRIDALKPGAAIGLGFLLSALNPKNLLLAAGGGATIASLSLTSGQQAGAVAIFTAIAAASVALPVIAYLIAGARLAPILDTAKGWLLQNNQAVMAVLFLVFGITLVGDGIEILTN